ncbi:MAG: hypothetical protein ABJN34_04775 [Litoreibacter sp.]|uniref:hypothetical protein n=1 Tax=Litoreibacter sp. TaxID=1969459 RepID=UPI00329861A8
MKNSIASIMTVLAGLAGSASADPADWTAGPFDMPESAIFDPTHDRILLSVIGGHPGEADGKGALALLSPEGTVLDAAWVTGLDAPKGMAIIDNTLLVADLTRLHEIDLTTGVLLRSVAVESAAFLNDVTSDGEQAFVSDFMTNRIWRYAAGEMTLWLEDDALAHPNGLLIDGNRLVVGSWGQGLRDDFSTDQPGSLLAVNLDDQEVSILAPDLGNLDGVVRIGAALLVNDWITGQLFEVSENGTASVVAEYDAGLADIAAYGNTLLLPSMLNGTVSAQSYP